MSKNMSKWLEGYSGAGRLVTMDFSTFLLFLHGGWGSAGK